MSTITQFLDKMHIGVVGANEAAGSATKVSFQQISEAAWGVVTFALFLVLGPFSAIAAVCSLVSLAKQGNGAEPEAMF